MRHKLDPANLIFCSKQVKADVPSQDSRRGLPSQSPSPLSLPQLSDRAADAASGKDETGGDVGASVASGSEIGEVSDTWAVSSAA